MKDHLWAWHGTRLDLNVLDVAKAMAKGGYDQHGSGLYLTDNLADSLSYCLPTGYLWRCMLDENRLSSGATVVYISQNIIHYIVTDQRILLQTRKHRLVQNPACKLNHGERMRAAANPDAWNLSIDPSLQFGMA